MCSITSVVNTLVQNVLLFFIFWVTVCCRQVAIKIVEEPTNYGLNGGGYQAQEESNSLQMRITPSNFSGPIHLKGLAGRCFTKIFESYKYEFCPFSNVTQHEQSLRWNPYSGILGVWQEWEIANNTFVAMVMGEGDSCGSVHRSTKVLLRCGEDHSITKVSEPSTCHYELVFETPYACHPHALLVYPTLVPALRTEWNAIEGQLKAETITQQGYTKLLHRVFEKAHYMLPESKKQQMAATAKVNEGKATKDDTFDSLYQCQGEYRKLKEEVDSLKTLLRTNGISDAQIAEAVPHQAQPETGGDHQEYDQDHNNHHYQDYQWMHDD